MNQRTVTYLAVAPAIILLLQGVLASPIVVRHDRDEQRFRELGVCHADALVLIRARDDAGIVVSEGTLIGTHFVLTAAHVAQNLTSSDSLLIGAERYPVRRATLHPEWQPNRWVHDIAVVELAKPVSDVEPVPLYRWKDEAEKEIILVGRGMYGTGLTGPTDDDGTLLGATNRIDLVLPEWLRFTFDAPDSPTTTELEGISGPGDSGGPGFVLRNGARYLAGVSSVQDDSASGGRPGRYGVQEYYVRVSTHAKWIDSVMNGS